MKKNVKICLLVATLIGVGALLRVPSDIVNIWQKVLKLDTTDWILVIALAQLVVYLIAYWAKIKDFLKGQDPPQSGRV